MSDPARMVDEIRAILAAFDWERDDRQYALERIEMIVMTEPEPDAEPAGSLVPLSAEPEPCPAGCEHPLTVHSADLGCWLCDCIHGRPAL